MKYARAYRRPDDSVYKVVSYDGDKEWRTADEARADGYEVLYNNLPCKDCGCDDICIEECSDMKKHKGIA